LLIPVLGSRRERERERALLGTTVYNRGSRAEETERERERERETFIRNKSP
jgi:hypothetical protein